MYSWGSGSTSRSTDNTWLRKDFLGSSVVCRSLPILLLQCLRHRRFIGSPMARDPGRLLPVPADPSGNPFPDTVHVFVPLLFLSVVILPDSQALVWRHKRIAQKTMRMIYPHRLSILCATLALLTGPVSDPFVAAHPPPPWKARRPQAPGSWPQYMLAGG